MDWARLARETNPVVRTIVADLQRDYAQWCDKVQEFELASMGSTAGEPNVRAEELQRELHALAVDIESYVAELNYLGVAIDVRHLFMERP